MPSKHRTQQLNYEDFLQQKVDASRVSMRQKKGRSNEEVEAEFAEKRINVIKGHSDECVSASSRVRT